MTTREHPVQLVFKTEFETVTTCSQGWFLMRTLGWHDINYHNKMTDMRSVIDIVIYYSGFVTHFDRYFSMRLTNQNRIGISIKLNVHAFLVEISRIPVCCEVSFVLWIWYMYTYTLRAHGSCDVEKMNIFINQKLK